MDTTSDDVPHDPKASLPGPLVPLTTRKRHKKDHHTQSNPDDAETNKMCRNLVRNKRKCTFQVNRLHAIPRDGRRGLDTLVCLYGGEDWTSLARPYQPKPRDPFHGLVQTVHHAWQNRLTLVLEPITFLMIALQGLVMNRLYGSVSSTASQSTVTTSTASKSPVTSSKSMTIDGRPSVSIHIPTELGRVNYGNDPSSKLPLEILEKLQSSSTSSRMLPTRCMIRPMREARVDYPISMLVESESTEKRRTRPGFSKIQLVGTKQEWQQMLVTVQEWLTEMPWWATYFVPIIQHLTEIRLGRGPGRDDKTERKRIDEYKIRRIDDGKADKVTTSSAPQPLALGNTRAFWNQMYTIQMRGRQLCVAGWINALFPFRVADDAVHDHDNDIRPWCPTSLEWVQQRVPLSEPNMKYQEHPLLDVLTHVPSRQPWHFPVGVIQTSNGVIFGFDGSSDLDSSARRATSESRRDPKADMVIKIDKIKPSTQVKMRSVVFWSLLPCVEDRE